MRLIAAAGRARVRLPAWRPGEGLALAALLAGSLALFALLPAGRLLWAAFVRDGAFAPDTALDEILSRSALRALGHSLETGIASAVLALGLGLAAALAVTLTDVRGRRLFSFLFVLSMLMAPQVVALAYIAATGPASPLLNTLGLAPPPGTPNPLRSPGGIVLILAVHHAPLAFVTLRAALRRIPRELVEAAALDGATGARLVWSVVLPLLRGALVAAGLLCFVAALGNFGIPALLGLPVNYLTLPTLIYRRLSSLGPSAIGDAAAVGALLMALTGLGVLAARRLTRGAADQAPEPGAGIDGLWSLGRASIWLQSAMALTIVIVLGIPLAALLSAALAPTYGVALTLANVTLDNFVEVLARQPMTGRALLNSLLFSAAAAVIVAVLALPLAQALTRRAGGWREPIEGLFEIPYALPGVVLAVACILVFLRPLPVIEVSLYGTPAIIVFAYVARFLPLALKPVAAALGALDRGVEEAAAVCGAGPWRQLRHILAPAAAPAMAAGALLTFLIAFNELTVSALLWSRGTITLGVVLFGLEEAGLVSQAAAVGLVSFLVILGVMLLLDRLAPLLPDDVLPWR